MRKKIIVQDVSISYFEMNEHAEHILFFIHGNSSSAQTWQQQLTSELLSGYRLIAFDLPGHGSSDFLAAEKYSVFYFAELLAQAIKQLAGTNPYIITGFCFGACMAYETLAFNIKPKGLVLLSPNVVGDDMLLQDNLKPDHTINILGQNMQQPETIMDDYRKMIFADDAEINKALHDYLNTCPAFKPALMQIVIKRQYSNGPQLLQQAGVPLLVVFGDDDRIVNPDFLNKVKLPYWNNRITKLEGGCHFVYIQYPEKLIG